jgi:hypothetical protein
VIDARELMTAWRDTNEACETMTFALSLDTRSANESGRPGYDLCRNMRHQVCPKRG